MKRVSQRKLWILFERTKDPEIYKYCKRALRKDTIDGTYSETVPVSEHVAAKFEKHFDSL